MKYKIEKIEKIKIKVKSNMIKLKRYKNVIGFGAPAKATTALNYFGLKDKIQFIIEDNNLKDGNTFQVNIQISKERLTKIKLVIMMVYWS